MQPQPQRYPPVSPKCPHIIHGGDYNPEQWEHYPGIWDEDMRLAKLARCNCMTVGIFSWAALEPEEGRFEFGWLDRVMDMLARNGLFAILATPSGARPAWLSQKYPEVLRVEANQQRIRHGHRHNHCYTSPVYREKVAIINRALAERYGSHPAVLLWHLSNEYGGACYCDLCQEEFRRWLRNRYGTLEALNEAWWTRFWSHTYNDWSQIEAPMPHGEGSMPGHHLDWRRFVSDRHTDFARFEAETVKAAAPDLPVTTNMMGTYTGINYRSMAKVLDIVSWDNYPQWHRTDSDVETAVWVSMVHSLNRSLKGGRPFLMMESTPSTTNWMECSKNKRPGMHLLSSLQAVALGSDSVQYFQWRKSRGAVEQYHGAVVDHSGHEHTRVFREVAQVGEALATLDDIVGTTVPAEAALIYDWEVRWAIDDCQAITKKNKDYEDTCRSFYAPLWARGIGTDIIGMDDDFSRYRLLLAPMLYLIRPGVGERLESFVENGGTLVVTYWSGLVNESTLCFLGGFPGPLRKVLGIWVEETDTLWPGQVNAMAVIRGAGLGLKSRYDVHTICDVVHGEGAETRATYVSDYYAGMPVLTVNRFGKGEAWYVAARTGQDFLDDFVGALADRLSLRRALPGRLPEGVTASERTDGQRRYVFVMNFASSPRTVPLGASRYTDMLSGSTVSRRLTLPRYGVRVLREESPEQDLQTAEQRAVKRQGAESRRGSRRSG